MEILSKTQSVCPHCLEVIDAYKVSRPDGIYLEKNCEAHGDFSVLIWEGSKDSFLSWDRGDNEISRIPPAKPGNRGCPNNCGLCEEHRCPACCVLLEVTKRCNLGCPVCFASASDEALLDPTLEEIDGMLGDLMNMGGPFNLQLSGGEPTVRNDLPQIIQRGRRHGFSFFQLNTNGLRLAREEGYAGTLKQAGLDCVFLQFDGLSAEPYKVLRGKNILMDKMLAIDACAEAGLGVVLVPTVAAGINDHEIGAMLRFAIGQMPAVRGVHFQPLSFFGRYTGLRPTENRITIPRMLRAIEEQTAGQMKAKDFVGGGAENAYCSFHANYQKKGAALVRKGRTQTGCCLSSKQSREAVARQWRMPAEISGEDGFADYLRDEQNTLAVSGMLFQDAWTLDLERLRQCYICEADLRYGLVPFCAYNLSSVTGKSRYRGSYAADET